MIKKLEFNDEITAKQSAKERIRYLLYGQGCSDLENQVVNDTNMTEEEKEAVINELRFQIERIAKKLY